MQIGDGLFVSTVQLPASTAANATAVETATGGGADDCLPVGDAETVAEGAESETEEDCSMNARYTRASAALRAFFQAHGQVKHRPICL